MKHINDIENPVKKILFLGYDENQTQLIQALVKKNCLVDHTNEKIDDICGYDFVVSYGYQHILKKRVIEGFGCPIFNLHISYLPYNRGAHPNFWSFYDNTPSGVTIHLIDEGIDTGFIVSQKYVNFKEDEDTFVKTYTVLINEIESLFMNCINSLLSGNWVAKKQRSVGTHHYAKNLPSNFSGWNSNIKQEIEKLYNEGLKYE
jgi:methionyl-tRNA formyltransferase